ncbi:MAG: hypothetical protein ACRD0P_29440 [Stackebrandtia sp.]
MRYRPRVGYGKMTQVTDHPTGHHTSKPDAADGIRPEADDDVSDVVDTDHDGPQDGGPQPGIRPGGTKPRRTASMKVARPASPPDEEFDDEYVPWNNPWADKVRRLLDSSAGKSALVSTAVGAPLIASPLTIYSVFALAYLWRRPLQRTVARLPLGPRTTLALLIILAGLLRDSLTWVIEYIENDQFILLWRPQLVPTLLISLGVYTAWAFGWTCALWWHRYRLGEVLLVQAVFGLVVDRFGLTMLAGLDTMPFGLLLWSYAMVVSASTLGVAWLLAGDKLAGLSDRPTEGAFRYTAPALLTGFSILLIFMVWGPLLGYFDALPDRAPIQERPFW